jgi:hypothetical protein
MCRYVRVGAGELSFCRPFGAEPVFPASDTCAIPEGAVRWAYGNGRIRTSSSRIGIP